MLKFILCGEAPLWLRKCTEEGQHRCSHVGVAYRARFDIVADRLAERSLRRVRLLILPERV